MALVDDAEAHRSERVNRVDRDRDQDPARGARAAEQRRLGKVACPEDPGDDIRRMVEVPVRCRSQQQLWKAEQQSTVDGPGDG